MRIHIPIHMRGYQRRQEISLKHFIDPSFTMDDDCLYSAVNYYSPDSYDSSHKIQIYAFRIERQTKCFFILANGARVNKKLTNKMWSATPEDAARAAIVRAENYLNILVRRGHQVSDFLRQARTHYPGKTKELYDFARDAKSMLDMDPQSTPTEDDF